MDIIRESLSNFHDISKNFSNIKSTRKEKDDEYIEEEFEEDIPEVEEDIPEDKEDNSSEEEHKFEVIRKENKSTIKSRPVSAVYDLS